MTKDAILLIGHWWLPREEDGSRIDNSCGEVRGWSRRSYNIQIDQLTYRKYWRYIKFGDLVIEHQIVKLKTANINVAQAKVMAIHAQTSN